MVIARRQPGFPEGPVTSNGHATCLVLGDLTIAFPQENANPCRESTRYLAAATQENIWYAEFVVDTVINDRFRALAPSFGVDISVVAKWAIKALRTRALRDYILSAILITLALVPLLAFLWLPALLFMPLLLIAAWLTISWEYWERIHNVITRKMLWDRFSLEEAPIPRRDSDRRRLDVLAERRDGNLVVFSGHAAFIGSGWRIQRRHVLIDVSRGVNDEDGNPKKPEPFTSQDLHTALVEAFGEKDGLGKRLDNVRAYERLFVNGRHVQKDERLRPKPAQPPETTVSRELLTEAALRPTPDARTYVCVEMVGWEGQLVVTLFVRAVRVGDSLYIEWEFRVLPPLRADLLNIDKRFEVPFYLQAEESLRTGMRDLLAELLASPFNTCRRWRRPYIRKRYERGHAYAVENGYTFDYGAKRSIREKACGRQRHHHFLARDEIMYVLLAQQTLSEAVADFLRKHGVDQGEFNEQVNVIINDTRNTYNSTVNVSGSAGVVVGDNSKASVGDQPKGAK
jgi:hypothetical protein